MAKNNRGSFNKIRNQRTRLFALNSFVSRLNFLEDALIQIDMKDEHGYEKKESVKERESVSVCV